MELLLENALVLLDTWPYRFERRNILIDGQFISKVSKNKLKAQEKLDCTNKVVLPAFINSHTHSPMSILRGSGEDSTLNTWLKLHIWPLEKKLTDEDIYWGTLLSIIQMFENGIATFNEHYFNINSIVKAIKKANIRSVIGYSMIDLGDFDSKGAKELEIASKIAYELKQDKSFLLAPSINPHAPNTCSKELLRQSAILAKKLNCVLHTHLAETAAEFKFTKEKYGLSPTELLFKTGCLSEKSVLAHSIYVTKKDIKLIKKSKSSVAHCPIANLKLASGSIAPIKEFFENNINLCLGTDGPASNNSLNLLESAKIAILLQKNLYKDASILSADHALYMLTEGGAKALGINSGSIKEGKLADLVFFDLNSPELVPFSNSAAWIIYSASSASITDLLINGKFVLKDKKLLTINKQEVIKKLSWLREKLLLKN